MSNTKYDRTSIIIIVIIFFVFVSTLALLLNNRSTNSNTPKEQSKNVLLSKDLQTISIEANDSGYTPSTTIAVANIDTKLVLNSIAAYGCAQSLTIPKLGIKKILPTNGKAEVSIPAQEAGTTLLGSCSMGMYTFTISFI